MFRDFLRVIALSLVCFFLFNQRASAQCSNLSGSFVNDLRVASLCAPTPVTWNVEFEFLFSVSVADTDKVYINIRWNDPGNNQVTVQASPNGNRRRFSVSESFTYPATGGDCSYEPIAFACWDADGNGIISGAEVCVGSRIEATLSSWSTDDSNGGTLAINPAQEDICVDDSALNFQFQDATFPNCEVTVEPDVPNQQTRWVQFIYGTNVNPGPYIPLVSIDTGGGTVQITDAAGAIITTFAGPIIEIPAPVLVGDLNELTYPISYPGGVAAIGDVFEITLRNWNICNPYDTLPDGNPPTDPVNGDFPAITTEAILNVIGPTPATAGPDQDVCGTSTNFAANTPGTGTGTWSQLTGPTVASITDINDPTSNVSIGGGGAAVKVYTFEWSTALGGCATSVDTVQITFYRDPNNPNAGPDQDICGLSTTMAANNITRGFGQWVQTGGPVANPGLSSIFDRNATLNVSTSGYGVYTFDWTANNPPCAQKTNEVVITFEQDPTTPNAGPDDTTVCNSLNYTLAGNSIGVGTGTWTKVSGPVGAVTFAPNANDPTATATLPTYGTFVLRWTATNGTICADQTDDVTISAFQTPTVSVAGIDSTHCGLNINLYGNTPTVGQGMWTHESGPGPVVFVDATDPNTLVTVPNATVYRFRWTISNGNCPDSFDDVFITFGPPADVANAGPDDSVCASEQITLGANDPTPAPSLGTGTWTIINGPAGYVLGANTFISNVNDHNAVLSWDTLSAIGNGPFSYTLVWTVTKVSCPTTTDTVVVWNYPKPTSAVVTGLNPRVTCALTQSISANPLAEGHGQWTQVSGPGISTFVDDTLATTNVTVSQSGYYRYKWEVVSGPCSPPSRDTLDVDFTSPTPSAAGNDTSTCAFFDTLNANTPTVGSGTWTVVGQPVGGTLSFDDVNKPNARTDLSGAIVYGTYTLRWTITNAGCTDEVDEVDITFFEDPTVPNAGTDIFVCANSTNMAANAITIGTGRWKQVSGPASIVIGNVNLETSLMTAPAFSDSAVYELEWASFNGVCDTLRDTVQVTFYESPTNPNAGTDIAVCATSTNLAGNAITVGIGTWTQVSGPPTLTITSPNSETSAINISGFTLDSDTFLIEWATTNGNCPVERDTVQVIFHNDPTPATAGTDIDICADTAILSGNPPTVGTGTWTQVSGTGALTIDNNTDPNTTVRNPVFGANDSSIYLLEWATSNGNCIVSRDTVQVVFFLDPDVADAGLNDAICALTYTLAGNSPPYVGRGLWTLGTGPGTASFVDPTDEGTDVTVTAYGLYKFYWTLSNGPCPSNTDSVLIRFDEFPSSASAGLDDTVCALTYTLDGNVPGVGTGEWSLVSGPGTATFVDSSQNNTDVTVSSVGTYEFEWRISNGVCADSTDNVIIIFAASGGNTGVNGDTTQCIGATNEVYDVPFVPGTTYEWLLPANVDSLFGGGEFDNFYVLEFNTAGTFTIGVIPTNNFGCSSDTQTTDVTVYDFPTIDAGPDHAICSGDTVVLGGAPTASGGSGVFGYNWFPTSGLDDATAANPNAFPTFDRSYFLTVTDSVSGCITQQDTAVVTVNSSPSSQLLVLDPSICEGDSARLYITFPTGVGPFSVSISTGADTLVFPSVSNPDTLLVGPDSTITYQVIAIFDSATSCVGSTFVGAATVNVRALPTATLSTLDSVICEGDIANLNISVSGPAPQIYTIEYAINGQDTTVFNLVGGSGTIPVAPDSTSLYTLISVTDNFRSCQVNAPSIRFTDSVLITVDSLPRGILTGGDTICAGDSAALVANFTVGDGPFTLVINNLGTINNYNSGDTIWVTPTSTTVYSLASVSDSNSCVATGSLIGGSATIIVNPLPVATLLGTSTICLGDTANLSVLVTVGTGPFTVIIDNGDTVLNYNNLDPIPVAPLVTTSYNLLEVTDTFGCTTSAPSPDLTGNPLVTVNPLPTAQVQQDDTICNGQTTTLTFSMTGQTPFIVTFRNNTTGQDSTIATVGSATSINLVLGPDTTTIYSIVSVMDGNGCMDSVGNPINPAFGDSVEIFVRDVPSATLAADTTICDGQTGHLFATVSNGLAPFTLNISGGVGIINNYNSGDTIFVNPSDTTDYYIISLTDANGCGVVAGDTNLPDTVTFNVNPLPVADLFGDATICFGDSTPIQLTMSPFTGPYIVELSNGVTDSSYYSLDSIWVSPTTTLTYNIVRVTDSTTGCVIIAPDASLTGSATITVNPLPTAQVASDDTICFGESTILTFSMTGQAPFTVTYRDNLTMQDSTFMTIGLSTSRNITVTPADTTIYSLVSVIDANGCADSINNPINPAFGDSVTIMVRPEPSANFSVFADVDTICNGDISYLTANLTVGVPPYQLIVSSGVGVVNNFNNGDSILVNPSITTQYWIEQLTDSNGCVVMAGSPNLPDTVTVHVDPLPTADLSGDATICFGDSTPLVLAMGPTTGPFIVELTNGEVDSSYYDMDSIWVSPTTTTTYTILRVTDSITGCFVDAPDASLTGSATITVNPLPTAQIGSDDTICFDDNVVLTLSMTGQFPFTVTYRDNTLMRDSTITTVGSLTSHQVTVSPDSFTIYSLVSVIDGNGCVDSINNPINPAFGDSTTIWVDSLPIAEIVIDPLTDTICDLDTAFLIVNVSTGPGPYNIQISGGVGAINGYISGTPIPVTPSTNTTYRLTFLEDANGCSVIDGHPNIDTTVTVVVNPLPVVELRLSQNEICLGDSAQLFWNVTVGIDPIRVVIDDDPSDTIAAGINDSIWVSPIDTTTYTILYFEDGNGCAVSAPNPNISGTPTLIVNPLATASIFQDDTICYGDNAELIFRIAGANAPYTVTYLDTGGAPLTQFNVVDSTIVNWSLNPGLNTFTLRNVVDDKGCVANLSADTIVDILVHELPTVAISGDTTLCEGETGKLYFDFTGVGPFTVVYTHGITQDTATLNGPRDSVDFDVTPSPIPYVYTLVEAFDSNLPDACYATSLTGTATVIMYERARISWANGNDTTICDRDSYVLTFDVQGGRPTYSVDISWSDGITVDTTLTGIGDNSIYIVSPSDTTTYTIVSAIEEFTTELCEAVVVDDSVVTINVNQLPTADVAVTGPTDVCDGDSITLEFNFTGQAPWDLTYLTTYAGTLDTLGVTANPLVLQVAPPFAGSYSVSILSVKDGHTPQCQVFAPDANITGLASFTTHGLPSASLNPLGLTTVCRGDTTDLLVVASGGTPPYRIFISDGAGYNIDTTFNSNTIVIPVFPTNTTTFSIDSLMDSNALTAAGCMADTANLTGQVTVTVNDRPTAGISGIDTVCSLENSSFQITLGGTGPWFVQYSDGTNTFPTVATSSPHTVTVINPSVGTNVYKIVTVSDNGLIPSCPADSLPTDSAWVHVNDLPSATLSGDTSICEGDLLPLALDFGVTNGPFGGQIIDGNGVTYPFTGLLFPTDTVLIPYTQTGLQTYFLDSVIDEGTTCEPLFTVGQAIVTIRPTVTVDLSGSDTICDGAFGVGRLFFDFTDANGTAQGAYDVEILRNGIPVDTALQATPGSFIDAPDLQVGMNNYTVGWATYTSVGAATPPYCDLVPGTGADILVHPLPNATIQDDDTICNGQSTTLTFDLTGQAPFDIRYSAGFTSEDTVASTGSLTISVSPANRTTYALSIVTDANGCSQSNFPSSDSTEATIIVNDLPLAQLRIDGFFSNSVNFCEEDTAALQILLTGNGPFDVEVGDNLGNTYNRTGFNSGDTIQVFPPLSVPVRYFINSVFDSHNPTCSPATLTDTVTIFTDPLPTGDLTGDTTICLGATAPLRIDLTGIGPWNIQVDGVPGTTQVLSSPFILDVTPVTTTTYRIISIVDVGTNNDCGVDSTHGNVTGIVTVTVAPEVFAGFTFTEDGRCGDPTFTFTDTTAPPNTYSYFWSFGDGDTSTLQNPVHQYNNTTLNVVNYDVTLIATTVANPVGCQDSVTQTISVRPAITADLTVSEDSGCSPFEVTFTSNNAAVSRYWDFESNGTDLQVGNAIETYTFENTGLTDVTFNVWHVVENQFACRDTLIQDIRVFALPKPAFTANPQVQNWPISPVSFTNNTPNVNTFTYFWDFGDGLGASNAINPPDYTYNTWGDFDVQLTATSVNGCVDSFTQTVTILPELPVASLPGDTAFGCAPYEYTFTHNSQFAFSSVWKFTDGQTYASDEVTRSFLTPGDQGAPKFIGVWLVVTGLNGFQDSTFQQVIAVVYPTPQAAFTTSFDTVFAPNNKVNFNNFSLYYDSLKWDFGDGTTAFTVNPTHTYEKEGEYDITMIAYSDEGCTDTAVRPMVVKPTANIFVPNVFIPNPAGPSGGDISSATGQLINTVFYPVPNKPVKSLIFQIFNRWGEVIFESQDVNIGWDGYVNGKLATQSVYIYRVDVKFTDGSEETIIGDVTLLR